MRLVCVEQGRKYNRIGRLVELKYVGICSGAAEEQLASEAGERRRERVDRQFRVRVIEIFKHTVS